jgi:hypothetical protein|tara:strand:- start:209 stop:574 length:366 start_codon:yes stop_codon:yes gene_type:complete
MKQILYPKYMFFIASYAVILFTLGITFAKFIDKLFMDFDKEKNVKSRARLWGEMLIQVVLSVMGSYILRELIDVLFREILGLERHIFGNPDRFAVIIVAPTMFYTQKNLQKKIMYLWNLKN